MNVPDRLSPEAAMALFDLLGDLERTVWEQYGQLLIPPCLEQVWHEDQAQDTHEDLTPREDFNDPRPLF